MRIDGDEKTQVLRRVILFIEIFLKLNISVFRPSSSN